MMSLQILHLAATTMDDNINSTKKYNAANNPSSSLMASPDTSLRGSGRGSAANVDEGTTGISHHHHHNRHHSSPLVSALALQNARHMAQLRAYSSSLSSISPPSTSWTNVGSRQQAAEQPPTATPMTPKNRPGERRSSGIVSHLRNPSINNHHRPSSSTTISNQNREQYLNQLVSAKTSFRNFKHPWRNSAPAMGHDVPSLWALQRAHVLRAASASRNTHDQCHPHSQLFPPGYHTPRHDAASPAGGLLLSSCIVPDRLTMAAAGLMAAEHAHQGQRHMLMKAAASASGGSPASGSAQPKTKSSMNKKASSSRGTSMVKPDTSPTAKRRPPTSKLLFMDCDEESLSEYQCLIRQQMELFEATNQEASSNVQGRNKQVSVGQVGIRCRHCNAFGKTTKGSCHFPTKLDRVYQAAQNLSAFHLCGPCPNIPPTIQRRLVLLKERKSPAGGGKRYWAEGVHCLGVIEANDGSGGLRFASKSA